MKVIIEGRTYDGVLGDDITLADLMAIKTATGMTRADLMDLIERVAQLSEVEQQRSDEALIAAGISVWLARRHAGELLTLEEACAVKMSQVEFVREPGDPQPETPGGRPDPTSRAGSARHGTRSPQDRKPKSAKPAARKTSKKASPAGS